ncbi:MAG: SMP-30/gluconolactonase/LRE family protein [Acidobacteria bacterium]|nr:SMP-30/gluconolactonase/LRE family protein [Acidobacteriota bacterium]
MRHQLTLVGVGLALLCSVPVFAQGAAPQPFVAPAFDTYTPNIPGVVAGGTRVELITDQLSGTEGPVALADGTLLFTEGGARRLTRIDKDGTRSTFLDNIQSGGLGFDPKGRLIANDNTPGKQGIYIVHPKGVEKTLVDRGTQGFMGANDLVVNKKGGVYFTQPDQANVGYIRPDGTGMTIVAENITRPNGITLSPDEKILYVNDSRGEYLLAYDVRPDGSVTNRRNFARYDQINTSAAAGDVGPGLRYKFTSCADGLAVDKEGRVYNAGCNGIQVYSPQGRHLGTIPTARVVQNLAFAGPDKKTLYLVGRSAAWKIQTLTQGYPGRAK